MSANNSLERLIIRTGVVRAPNAGYILAGDPQKESKDIGHAVILTWEDGNIRRGEAEFNAHTCCLFKEPEPGMVIMSGSGNYAVKVAAGIFTGNIFEADDEIIEEERYGDIGSVAEIGKYAYAVGLEGTVYRLDEVTRWTRLDHGLPSTFDIEAIDGFDMNDIYAVGSGGEMWHYNGTLWMKRELPTNASLHSVRCAGDGIVYAAGEHGIIVQGRTDTWSVVEHEDTTDEIWDLEWFSERIYACTMFQVFTLDGDHLAPISFEIDPPSTCYHLSTVPGVMWSIGEKDVVAFDGRRWSRIV